MPARSSERRLAGLLDDEATWQRQDILVQECSVRLRSAAVRRATDDGCALRRRDAVRGPRWARSTSRNCRTGASRRAYYNVALSTKMNITFR